MGTHEARYWVRDKYLTPGVKLNFEKMKAERDEAQREIYKKYGNNVPYRCSIPSRAYLEIKEKAEQAALWKAKYKSHLKETKAVRKSLDKVHNEMEQIMKSQGGQTETLDEPADVDELCETVNDNFLQHEEVPDWRHQKKLEKSLFRASEQGKKHRIVKNKQRILQRYGPN